MHHNYFLNLLIYLSFQSRNKLLNVLKLVKGDLVSHILWCHYGEQRPKLKCRFRVCIPDVNPMSHCHVTSKGCFLQYLSFSRKYVRCTLNALNKYQIKEK